MRRLGSIDSVSRVLEGLARRLGLESKMLESRLRRGWIAIVGEPIASNTRPDHIRYKKLYLVVGNSVWLHQLTFLKPTLIHNIKGVDGGELVTDIVFRLGELPETGHRPAMTEALPSTASPMSDALLAEISVHVSAIHDPLLRDQLTQLMAQALTQPRAPKGGSAGP